MLINHNPMMLGTRTLRDRSASRDPDSGLPPATKHEGKKEARERTSHAGWTEPSLAQKPSHRDVNGGSYYSVSEHMQPLGELPNARVKARVKMDGGRKSLLGKGVGAAGADAQETPEGTPAPQGGTQAEADLPPPPLAVHDDEDDEDYAPAGNGKKAGKRVVKARTAKRASTMAATPTASSHKGRHAAHDGGDVVNRNRVYNKVKMKQVVEAAKARATAVGKGETAAAIQQIYLDSLQDARLTELLEAILLQNATKAQTAEFHDYVRTAKRKIKEGKASSQAARELPAANNSTKPLTLRAPSFTTTSERHTKPSSALPSTEHAEPARPKISLKAKPRPEDSAPHPTRNSASMSLSPSKKRSGSVGSDSSLTDMTSNPDDTMDVDRVDDVHDDKAAVTNGTTTAKDHAAERGSLAPPNRNLKRSSAEAELAEEASDRVLAAKKQKLSESVHRDEMYQESNLRTSSDMPAGRNRSLRSNKDTPMTSPQSASKVNGARGARTRGNTAASPDPDSPLSELSPMSSRQTSPHIPKGATTTMTTGKKAKTKQSPEKKHHVGRGMTGLGGAGADSPIGDEDNEELSENNDFCSACGGSGFLLCCDGCDRSFHFSCLDPPLNEDASELNEPWYCYICVAKRPVTAASPEKPLRGLFAPLFGSLKKRNPSVFTLPREIRDFFEGVATDKNGLFVEAVHTKTKTRPGYDETPDFTKIKDAKGNPILCYSCGKSSLGSRPIIQCDYCGQNWHLDCLDPPLANPPSRNLEGKKLHDWMCPLNDDHHLRKIDTSLLNRYSIGRKVHIRKPRNAKVVETSLRRGLRNNGVIEVVEDESDDSGSEFYDTDQEETVVYRLPASGIKLDFIDKVKTTRVQQLRSEQAFGQAKIVATAPPQLQQANFARRSFAEKQLALNLAQFATDQKDIDLGSDKIGNLIATLIAEAPAAVVNGNMADEEKEHAHSSSSVILPSPPDSELEQLSAEQRKELELLQELIRRRLEVPTT